MKAILYLSCASLLLAGTLRSQPTDHPEIRKPMTHYEITRLRGARTALAACPINEQRFCKQNYELLDLTEAIVKAHRDEAKALPAADCHFENGLGEHATEGYVGTLTEMEVVYTWQMPDCRTFA